MPAKTLSRRSLLKSTAAVAAVAMTDLGPAFAQSIGPRNVGVQAICLPSWAPVDVDDLAAELVLRPGRHFVGACVALNPSNQPGYKRIRRLLETVHARNSGKELTLILHLSFRRIDFESARWDVDRLSPDSLNRLVSRLREAIDEINLQLNATRLPNLSVLFSPSLEDRWLANDLNGNSGTDTILATLRQALTHSFPQQLLRNPMPANGNKRKSGADFLELHLDDTGADLSAADFVSNDGVFAFDGLVRTRSFCARSNVSVREAANSFNDGNNRELSVADFKRLGGSTQRLLLWRPEYNLRILKCTTTDLAEATVAAGSVVTYSALSSSSLMPERVNRAGRVFISGFRQSLTRFLD